LTGFTGRDTVSALSVSPFEPLAKAGGFFRLYCEAPKKAGRIGSDLS